MSTENDIRKASNKFYVALHRTLNGDARPMVDVWSHNSDVSTMHPTGRIQVGWDEVRASWEDLSKICSNGQLKLIDQRICAGSDFSYELGTEHLNVLVTGNAIQTDFRVTNIYRREGSEWRMVQHHADHNLTVLEILHKLEPSQQKLGSEGFESTESPFECPGQSVGTTFIENGHWQQVRDEALTGVPASQPLSRGSFKLVQGADAVSGAVGNMDRRNNASACSALRGPRPGM